MKHKPLKIGEKFNYLTVASEPIKGGRWTEYIFQCECGNTRTARSCTVISGEVKSCGCKNFSGKHGNSIYSPTESSFRAKAANYRAGAKVRGIEFLLSLEEVVVLLKQNCYYCNNSPSNLYNVRLMNRNSRKKKVNYCKMNSEGYDVLYNGIDRLDNNRGYIIGNVVSCCTQCNTAKMDYTSKEFREWIINIYNNFILKQCKSTS